ncbi:FtsW/RodA/SpoVE family cell cycle protein, partial [Acinetobacter baumannii]|nr:FtsW/RodA/SpoVE family cell cycle protein [Acinetobacter baumannii]
GSDNVSADAATQTTNAKMAVGSGQLLGKGLFSSGAMSQLGYIPDDHTDFIFSITCETFGFVGGMAVIILYTIMLLRMLVLSRRIEDRFASMTIVG